MEETQIQQNETNLKKDYSVSMLEANIYAFVLAGPILIIFFVLYHWVWGIEQIGDQWRNLLDQPAAFLRADLLFLLIFVFGIVLHEFIHGITWAWAAKKPWSSIKFGFQLKTLTPYCHIKEPIPVNPYRLGAVMPGIITGFLPALLGLIYGNVALFAIGLLFIFAAGGDLMILWSIRKVDSTALVEDHPTRAGCFVHKMV